MTQKPLIFITNDDGYLSNGIKILEDILRPMGKVIVVAPSKEMSGQSHSITVGKPLKLSCITKEDDFEEYSLEGTPVDCVKMAFDKVLNRKPDFLFAGINHGSNVSINTIYSGTMAAVMEGCSEGVASVGFSLCDNDKNGDLSYCIPFVKEISENVIKHSLPKEVCLNVNFPVGQIKGIKVGHQAKGYWSEDFTVSEQEDGKSIFWLGGEYHCEDKSSKADWNIINENYGAIVPMQVDFTAHRIMKEMEERFENSTPMKNENNIKLQDKNKKQHQSGLKTIILTIMALLSIFSSDLLAQKTTNEEDFKYILDEFADCKVMRYRLPDWDSLSLKQKQYIYCLSEAALWGRDIYFDQNYKHNLQIRKALEYILTNYKGNKTSKDYKDFEVYAKRFFFSNGLHHHYGEKKFFPDCPKSYFASLLKGYKDADFILEQIYNENIAPIRRDNAVDKDIVKTSAVNFYENVSRQEAEDYYSNIEIDTVRPVSLGINSKLIKQDGKLKEVLWKQGEEYSYYIEKIIYWLEKALAFAENDAQIQYTNKLIEFYKTGDLKTWDEYNILWSQDTKSICDYINGFIETYNDPLGMKGTWEALVNYKDLTATKRTQTICNNAQWFEDHSPVKPEYRKKKVTGVSAKVINAAMLSGDCYPTPPIGINLPNADWIRKEYGSKSVTIANLSDAYFYASMESPKSALKEFAYSEKEIEMEKQHGQLSDNLHTDMHECLGHASGQLLDTTPANALKEYSSALEEARADLFALYYLMDEKMVELGLIPSLETGMAQYDSYIRNGLLVQLARIPLGEKVTEAHMQDRKLISEYALQNGKGCVEKRIKDGKTYFVVTDYQQLRKTFGELLYIIQDIKSRGDYEAGKNLVETYGVNINYSLHKEVLERYNALGIKPYGGFVNPILTEKKDKKGNVTDIAISYPKTFLEQELQYGKTYSQK